MGDVLFERKASELSLVSIEVLRCATVTRRCFVDALVAMVTTDSSVCTSRIRQARTYHVYFEVRLQTQ
jgi:hypothetical protein